MMAQHLDSYRTKLAKALDRATPATAEASATKSLTPIGDDTKFAQSIAEATILAHLAGLLSVKEIEVPKAERALDGPDPALRFVNMPFIEAIDYFEGLGILSAEQLDELIDSERRRAFFVTRAASDTIRDRIHAQLRSALAEVRQSGDAALRTGLDDFVASIRSEEARLGFSESSRDYLETVYRTNVASAYNAGRFAAQTSPDVIEATGYWEYVTADDDRVRGDHAALHGKQWRIGDPEAMALYPPNGFNCRCQMVTVDREDVDSASLLRDVGNIEADDGFDGPPSLETP